MKKLLVLMGAVALVGVFYATDVQAQCCDKQCFVPAGCEAPTNQSSRACTQPPDSLFINPSFPVRGCSEVEGAGCLGGHQRANLEPPDGCACLGGSCVTDESAPGTDTSANCTASAIVACGQANALTITADDPDCPVCPAPTP